MHRTAHGILDAADTQRVGRNAASMWAGFVAWVTIIFVSMTTSFVMLVLDPPPVDPDFALASSLASVWLSLATAVYTLERAARRDV